MNIGSFLTLSAKDITFSYPGKENLFSRFSFTLPAGKFTILAGGNGCGKSTLVRILSGILPVSEGKILLNETPFKNCSFSQRKKILGFVPQELPEMEEITVRELLLTGCLAGKSLFSLPLPDSRDREKIQKILEELDLTHLAENSCASLSGGEFRRAAIGASLVQSPRILLLDEPCASLDYGHAQSLMRLLQKLCRKHFLTILMVSHDLILPSMYADHFVLMKKGGFLKEGKPENILNKENLQAIYHIPFELLYTAKGHPVPVPLPVPAEE